MEGLLQQGASLFGGQSGQQGGSSGGFDIGSIENLVSHASNNDQSGSGNNEMFSQAASYLKNNQGNIDSNNVDEDQMMQNHSQVTNSNATVGSNEVGDAAALSAIKSMLGGSGGGSSGGGDMKSKLIGAAMSHAGALYDQKDSAGQASGSKQDAMNMASEKVMALIMRYETGGLIGGSSTSGLSSLAMKLM